MENIAQRNERINAAIDRAKLSRDLLGGTPAMRKGGWIKKGGAEALADFENRVDGAVLFNGYARTVGYLTGQVFKKNLEIAEGSELQELFTLMQNDIDLQGNDLRTFAQQFFSDGLRDGARLILVQYPTIRMNEAGQYFDEQEQEWRTRTRDTDQRMRWRPYFINIGYDDVLGWRYEYRDGVKILTQLRIREFITEPGDLDIDDEQIEQVRLLERGSWSTWRKSTDKSSGGSESWYMVDEGMASIEDIPVAIFMPGERITDMTAIPALEDLAFLNLRHFIATADQHVLMQFVRRPPWFGRALVQGDESVTFGPGRMVHSSDPSAILQSVGIDPASVEAGRGELSDIENRMAMYGLQLLVPSLRGGTKTATQSQQESAESVSQLQNWAQSLKDCFDQAFKFAALYEGVEAGEEPEIKLPVDFQPGMGLEPQTLITAVERGIIPKQIAFEEFQRRGLVAENYSWQDVLATLQREDVGPTQMPGSPLDFLQTAANRERSLTPGQVSQTPQS